MSADQSVRTDAGFPSASIAWYAVGVLAIGWVLAYLDRQVIIILIESLRADLGLSDTQVSLVQGFAFSLFFVLAGIPIGRLVDRSNRRNILIFGLLVWSLMTIACGFASNFWMLFAARMGVGVGEACLAPASMSLVTDLMRPNRRGTAMGLMLAGTSIGNAASIFLGGMILQAIGPEGHVDLPLLGPTAAWQIVFFVVGAPGLLVALLLLTIAEPRRLERVRDADSNSFIQHLRRHPGKFALPFAAFGCSMVIGYGVSVWAPVVLMRKHGVSPGQVGVIIGTILLVLGPAGSTLGGAASDFLARRFGPSGRFGVALIVFPIEALVLVLWLVFDGPLYTTFLFAMIAPVLSGMINGSSYPALNQMVPNEMRGQVVAFYLVVANLAGLGLTPTIIALVTDHVFMDPNRLTESVVAVAAPAAVLGFILMVLVSRRQEWRSAAAVTAEQ